VFATPTEELLHVGVSWDRSCEAGVSLVVTVKDCFITRPSNSWPPQDRLISSNLSRHLTTHVRETVWFTTVFCDRTRVLKKNVLTSATLGLLRTYDGGENHATVAISTSKSMLRRLRDLT
jgi:hypothetical protein